MQTKYSAPGANGAGDEALSKSVATAEGVPGEVRSFVADVGDLIKATTSLTGEDLVRAKARLGERAAAAKASLAKMAGDISDRAQSTAKATDAYAHEKPWQAIGIGAVAGLLVGVLLARRRR